MHDNYDLVVIGSGPGGYVAAIKAAQSGLKVAIIEEKEIGGTCLNRGCVPTKALMHTTHLYKEMSMCEKLGIFTDNISIDVEKMYARKDEVVTQLRSGVEFLIKSNKIEIIQGKGQITGRHRVTVKTQEGDRDLESEYILIATGSVPTVLPIPGHDLPGIITSDEIMKQKGKKYESIIVIGGGVIGVEFATIFSSMGTKVTVIEAMDRILPTMDKEIAQNLNMILKKRGVSINSRSMVENIEEGEHGLICHFNKKGKEQSVEAEAVLVAIGRRVNLEGLFGEGISITCDRGIVVNENLQTSIPNIYAIGDVVDGNIQLAHVASAQGIHAVSHMIEEESPIDLKVIPSCIYTDPEIASVGMTVEQAKEQNIPVKIGKYSLAGNCKSVIEAQERSFIKLVFEEETEVLLGAHLMCARATDLISELTTAIVHQLTIDQLRSVIRPHPTFTEAVTEAVDGALGHGIHIIPKK